MSNNPDTTRRILVVDDEEDIRDVMDIFLSDMGYEVFTAENGSEALRIFRETPVPVILTDIKMPGMDGIELLKAVKTESPDTEVIMVTGHGDMGLAIKSLKHEAIDFITKPINDEVLEIALNRAWERYHMRLELRRYTQDLEHMVAEKTRRLLEAERLAAVGQTAATLAHSIKNITGGLDGGVFVVEKGFELDNRIYLQQGWDMVKRNIQKVRDLALDLLAFTKDAKPEFVWCDPNQPVREVIELMQGRAREYGLILTAELDETLPQIRIDPEALHRALLNLVTNAMDACTEAGFDDIQGRIEVRTSRSDDAAVAYDVIDNGIGMDVQTRERIFRNFFSTKGSRGTGLGLMITRKIVSAHDGDIQVTSTKGEGSRFVIRIPITANSPIPQKE